MHQPPRHALTDQLVTANVGSVGSVVSAMTAASVAVASVDPIAAVAQTSPADPTPMVCQKGNGLTPWHLVPMRLPASSPAISRLRAALALKSRVNGAHAAATETVDHGPSAANARNARNPQDATTRQSTRSLRLSRASLTSQPAEPRRALISASAQLPCPPRRQWLWLWQAWHPLSLRRRHRRPKSRHPWR